MEITNQNQLKELASFYSKQVLNDVKPDELVLVDSWINRYLESEISISETSNENGNESQIMFGMGSPELWSALIIPLVIAIVKDVIIPRLPKTNQKPNKPDLSDIRIVLNEKRESYEIILKAKCGNKKDAKKIMDRLYFAILNDQQK